MMSINLLDLNNDILNIIGDYEKTDNKIRQRREKEELMNKGQIINGKIIRFPAFTGRIPYPEELNSKEAIKEAISNYLTSEFWDIKSYAKDSKIRLSNDDKRKCFWVLFKRAKLMIFENNICCTIKVNYNIDDNEEKEFFEEYLKLKNLRLPKKTTFEYF